MALVNRGTLTYVEYIYVYNWCERCQIINTTFDRNKPMMHIPEVGA